jgi:hypothetical protein
MGVIGVQVRALNWPGSAFDISKEGNWLATGDSEGNVRVRDATGCLRPHTQHILSFINMGSSVMLRCVDSRSYLRDSVAIQGIALLFAMHSTSGLPEAAAMVYTVQCHGIHSAVPWYIQCSAMVYTVQCHGIYSAVPWFIQCSGIYSAVPWYIQCSAMVYTVQWYIQCSAMVYTVQCHGIYSAVVYTVRCHGIYSAVPWYIQCSAMVYTVQCHGIYSAVPWYIQCSAMVCTVQWAGLCRGTHDCRRPHQHACSQHGLPGQPHCGLGQSARLQSTVLRTRRRGQQVVPASGLPGQPHCGLVSACARTRQRGEQVAANFKLTSCRRWLHLRFQVVFCPGLCCRCSMRRH